MFDLETDALTLRRQQVCDSTPEGCTRVRADLDEDERSRPWLPELDPDYADPLDL